MMHSSRSFAHYSHSKNPTTTPKQARKLRPAVPATGQHPPKPSPSSPNNRPPKASASASLLQMKTPILQLQHQIQLPILSPNPPSFCSPSCPTSAAISQHSARILPRVAAMLRPLRSTFRAMYSLSARLTLSHKPAAHLNVVVLM